MSPIRRILVPTDFSESSAASIKYAAELAEKFGAEIVLIHVIQDLALVLPDAVMPVPVATPDLNEMIASARKGLQNTAAANGLDRFHPKLEVRVGSPAGEIVAAAKELNADLLCVSTHGRTGLAHLLLGSVAEKIVRHAPCPVLTVRPQK